MDMKGINNMNTVEVKNDSLSVSSNRDEIKLISNLEMVTHLGVKSPHYNWVISQLRKLYHKLEKNNASYLKTVVKEWEKIYSNIYEKHPPLDIFFGQVYLVIIAKVILSLKFSQKDERASNPIYSNTFDTSTQDGKFIVNLVKWLQDGSIIKESSIIFQKIAEILSKYDLTNINEDIFKGLYEEIIEQSHRHKLGEYYTPTWLVELILEEVFSAWNKDIPPKILDPACGSGTFLINSAINLKKRFSLSSKEIINYIAGFDINPIAIMVTKTNLALLLNEPHFGSFQISNRDALMDYGLFDCNTLNKYDVVVGNPPWLVLRSIKNKDYQSFVKKEMLRYKLINNGDTHLYTQLDTSTLFFTKSIGKYLKKSGIIAFVMPRSVIGYTYQHKNFRKFERPSVKLIKIIDLEKVSPLFNIPACVLIGIKGSRNSYPVPLEQYRGVLIDRDSNLLVVKPLLSIHKDKYKPQVNGEKKSYYYEKFKVGLSIFPRSLYFVDLKHINDGSITVKTSGEIYRIVKEPWRQELTGEIEKNFIFCTLLPWKMVPFGYIGMNPIVLPVIPQNDKYTLLDLEDIMKFRYIGLYNWFKEGQKIWDKYKTDKAKERFPRLLDRLNYNNLIEHQHPNNRYVVLYNATGKNITSCVVDKENLPYFLIEGKTLHTKGFIADVKTWFFETNLLEKAYYLSAILNSNILSKMIKPYQPRGLYGARAIHRRPLEFPIPKFDDENEMHTQIAFVGRTLHMKVKNLIQEDKSKNQIRSLIQDDIREIDKIVYDLLRIKGVV